MAQETLSLVTLEPYGRTVEVPAGRSLLELCLSEGIRLDAGCGGRGTCGKCIVRVVSGEVDTERSASLPKDDEAQGFVLACRSRVRSGTLVIEIPDSSVKPKTIYSAEAASSPNCEPFPADRFRQDPFFREGPLCTVWEFDVSPPTLEDPVSDYDRLLTALKALPGAPDDFKADLNVFRPLSGIMRQPGSRARAWVSAQDCLPAILHVEPVDDPRATYGVAVDIGTTSLSACLCNLSTLTPVAFARCLNSQAVQGADVITRIIHGSTPEGLAELTEYVHGDLRDLLTALLEHAGLSADAVVAVQCAGNTTMTQIALGVDPTHIRKEPYVATANVFPPTRAADFHLPTHPRAEVHFMPCVSSYVGGDITAGLVATGLGRTEEVSLFLDMGTNGEIALGCADWLVCCSCSVGPAFEGSGITSGMLAEPGAVDEVTLHPDRVEVGTIGGKPPVGLCGSGLIKGFAELFRAGLIDRSARFQTDSSHPCLRRTEEGLEFVVAQAAPRDVVITQPDLDNLLRSKAAVFAALHLCVEKMGLTFSDIARVLVAGAFGRHVAFEDAVRIGLLPDLPLERFEFVGNTSLIGARAGLGFRSAQEEARDLAAKMTYLELSGDNAYHEAFVQASFLPHTDLDLFPSQR